MGFLSKMQNYHSAGEGPSERNTEVFGQPVCSLYTELVPGDLHQKIEVKDEEGRTLYFTKSSVITIQGKTDLFDSTGARVAHLQKKPVSLHEKHYITMEDGQTFTMSNELFHIVKDITQIQGLGWQLRGNVIGLNFALYDQNDELIATVGQKLVSLHDRFSIDLYQPRHEKVVVAIVIQLQKMLMARREDHRE